MTAASAALLTGKRPMCMSGNRSPGVIVTNRLSATDSPVSGSSGIIAR